MPFRKFHVCINSVNLKILPSRMPWEPGWPLGGWRSWLSAPSRPCHRLPPETFSCVYPWTKISLHMFILATDKLLSLLKRILDCRRLYPIGRRLLSVAKFIALDWRKKVDSGIGLSSCRTARLHRLTGRYDNPMPEWNISPIQRLRIWLQISGFMSTQGIWAHDLLIRS